LRTPLAEKNNVEIKAPAKQKGGLLIRLPIKKTYCTKCQKLVRGKAQNSGNRTEINCPKCGRNLWSWSHLSWRGPRNEVSYSPRTAR
jgi:RNase P subunit RPR2